MRLPQLRALLMLVISIAACGQTYLPDVETPVGDFHGRVVDALTGQPIDGAVVVANWNAYYISSIPNIDSKRALLHVTETLTGSDGTFVVRNLGRDGPSSGWKRDPGAYPRLMVFKPGYAPRYGSQAFWQAPFDGLSRPLAPAEIARRYSSELGIVLALHEMTNDPDSGPNYRPSLLGYARGAASFLKGNVDRVDLSHNSAGARQAIQDQIHAFVVVDRELARLSDEKVVWDHGQIDRAIEMAKREGVGR